MLRTYLFPHRYKTLCWWLFTPCLALGMIVLFGDIEPAFLDVTLPFSFEEENSLFSSSREINLLNEIFGVLIIIGGLLAAFSRERDEDELVAKVRLDSLAWAFMVHYGVLLLAIVFVYNLSFSYVMVLSMFTPLIFFLVRFNWVLTRLRRANQPAPHKAVTL